MSGFTARCWALAAALAAGSAAAAVPVAAPARLSTEERLLKAWELWQAGQLARAQDEFRDLIALRPQYKLAWLLYGDLLNTLSGGLAPLPLPADDARVQALNSEMERRLITRDLASDAVPSNLIYVSGRSARAIVVDLKEGRLFLMERGDDGWHRVRDNYAGIGRLGFNKRGSGDLRTPVGVYRIDGYIPGSALPDLYGVGALPLNYPNTWDRVDRRNGHGIWIHGVPRDTYVRAPQSSQGCVTVANEDFEALHREVGSGTPVILADGVQWLYAEEAQAQEQEWMDRLERWRLAWLSDDRARVQHWYAQKLGAQPRYREFDIDHINLFAYPGEKDLVLAQFRASRRLENGRPADAPLEQYWRRTAGGWKIVLEHAAGRGSRPAAGPLKKKSRRVRRTS